MLNSKHYRIVKYSKHNNLKYVHTNKTLSIHTTIVQLLFVLGDKHQPWYYDSCSWNLKNKTHVGRPAAINNNGLKLKNGSNATKIVGQCDTPTTKTVLIRINKTWSTTKARRTTTTTVCGLGPCDGLPALPHVHHRVRPRPKTASRACPPYPSSSYIADHWSRVRRTHARGRGGRFYTDVAAVK